MSDRRPSHEEEEQEEEEDGEEVRVHRRFPSVIAFLQSNGNRLQSKAYWSLTCWSHLVNLTRLSLNELPIWNWRLCTASLRNVKKSKLAANFLYLFTLHMGCVEHMKKKLLTKNQTAKFKLSDLSDKFRVKIAVNLVAKCCWNNLCVEVIGQLLLYATYISNKNPEVEPAFKLPREYSHTNLWHCSGLVYFNVKPMVWMYFRIQPKRCWGGGSYRFQGAHFRQCFHPGWFSRSGPRAGSGVRCVDQTTTCCWGSLTPLSHCHSSYAGRRLACPAPGWQWRKSLADGCARKRNRGKYNRGQ